MVSFFFLANGNVSFNDKVLKIPIEDLNEISEKVFNSWTTFVYWGPFQQNKFEAEFTSSVNSSEKTIRII